MTTELVKPEAQAARSAGTATSITLLPPSAPGGEPVAVLVKWTRDGLVRSFHANVQLEQDQLYAIKGKTAITAEGYDRLNQMIGVSFILPDTVTGEDAAQHANPYMQRNPTTGELVCVTVYMIGIGRVPTGAQVAHGYILHFDLRTYIAQDFWAKWRKGGEPKAWGEIQPTETVGKLDAGKKAYALPGGVSLVVDLKSPDVLNVLSEHCNRQRFAERLAQTICRRIIMQRFVAVKSVGDCRTVAVVGWAQHDQDIQSLARKASEARHGVVSTPDGDINVTHDSGRVSDPDEVDAAAEADVAGDEIPEQEEPACPAVDPVPIAPPGPDLRTLRGNVCMSARRLGSDAPDVIAALAEAGFAKSADVIDSDNHGALQTANDALNRVELARLQQDRGPKADTPAPMKTATERFQFASQKKPY